VGLASQAHIECLVDPAAKTHPRRGLDPIATGGNATYAGYTEAQREERNNAGQGDACPHPQRATA